MIVAGQKKPVPKANGKRHCCPFPSSPLQCLKNSSWRSLAAGARGGGSSGELAGVPSGSRRRARRRREWQPASGRRPVERLAAPPLPLRRAGRTTPGSRTSRRLPRSALFLAPPPPSGPPSLEKVCPPELRPSSYPLDSKPPKFDFIAEDLDSTSTELDLEVHGRFDTHQ
ncbi:unnamed protein product [Urochloa humidicola]